MTDLPKTLRRILEDHAVVTHTKVENVFLSSDGTRRFLLKLEDGREVESVFMPKSAATRSAFRARLAVLSLVIFV